MRAHTHVVRITCMKMNMTVIALTIMTIIIVFVIVRICNARNMKRKTNRRWRLSPNNYNHWILNSPLAAIQLGGTVLRKHSVNTI